MHRTRNWREMDDKLETYVFIPIPVLWFFLYLACILMFRCRPLRLLGHEPDMVYLPPPRGSFVDHDFLKA